jgi:hypothetical protein
MMKSRIILAWSLILSASFTDSYADDALELPKQYAEAVLDVEGMI